MHELVAFVSNGEKSITNISKIFDTPITTNRFLPRPSPALCSPGTERSHDGLTHILMGYRGEPTGMMTRHHPATGARMRETMKSGARRHSEQSVDDLEGINVEADTRVAGYGGSFGRILESVRRKIFTSWGPGGKTSAKSRQIRRTKVGEFANLQSLSLSRVNRESKTLENGL